MKTKITRKDLQGQNVFSCGYCELQTLLACASPRYYNAGVYGWNYDVYDFDNCYIATGYRGMPGKQLDYELCRKYEELARAASWEERPELLQEFLQTILEGGKI